MMFERVAHNVYRYREGALAEHSPLVGSVMQGLDEGWRTQGSNGWNYQVQPSAETERLYGACLQVARELFKAFDVAESNSSGVWAYVTHGSRDVQGPVHSHANTATINMVYYLQVPQEPFPMGCLLLFDEPKVTAVTPMSGDLLIFPGSMHHMPISNVSQEFRMALNLEVRCTQPEAELFANINY